MTSRAGLSDAREVLAHAYETAVRRHSARVGALPIMQNRYIFRNGANVPCSAACSASA